MTDSYKIGYGKPPKATQFKPGQSGNPSGGNRKKMPTSLDEAIQQALEKKQTVMVNGKRKRLTRLTIITEQLIARAVSGDAAAMRELMRYERDRVRRVSVQQPDLEGFREVEVTLNIGDGDVSRKVEERLIEERLNAAREKLAAEQGSEEG